MAKEWCVLIVWDNEESTKNWYGNAVFIASEKPDDILRHCTEDTCFPTFQAQTGDEGLSRQQQQQRDAKCKDLSHGSLYAWYSQ